ncbi:organic solute transporter Ostalpha domain-containing protein [Trichoderma chlorosporum]
MVAMNQSSRTLVIARGNDDDDSCARPTVGDNGDVLSIGITTHTLLKILSAVFLSLTLLNSIIHITRHLARYTAPSQQRQIIRIILVPTVFAIFSFLSILFYQTRSWQELFYRLQDPYSRESGIAGGNMTWFKRTCVFTASSIVEIATQGAGVYCCKIINIVAIMLAVPHLILFGLLNGRLSHPTTSITFNNLYYGIPATLTYIEAWIFTIIFMWSFSTKEYAPKNIDGQCYRMSFWRALLDSLNIADLVGAIATLIRILMEGNWQPVREDQNNGRRK